MDLQAVRQEVAVGGKLLRITTHAQIEAFKEGLALSDLRHVFETGRIIEECQEEARALVYGQSRDGLLPVHLVLEDGEGEVVVITTYVPDPRGWIGFTQRKPRQRR